MEHIGGPSDSLDSDCDTVLEGEATDKLPDVFAERQHGSAIKESSRTDRIYARAGSAHMYAQVSICAHSEA